MSVHTIHAANIAIAAPTIATIFGWLPVGLGLLATVLACVVYGLQIYDWFEQRRNKRTAQDARADVRAEARQDAKDAADK